MKRGKLGKHYFTFIFIFIFIVALFSVAYFTGFLGRITGLANQGVVGLNVTIGAFYISTVYNATSSSTLNLGPQSTSFLINFTVYDGAGATYVNYSTAKINVSMLGEQTRTNASCERTATGSSYVNFTCNVTMFWFDAAGGWNISASIFDNFSNFALNGSDTLTIAAQTALTLSVPTGNLSWSPMAAGASNQTATNDPLNLTNVGNQPIGNVTGNVTINGTSLFGETTPSQAILIGNITVSVVTGGTCTGATCTECDHKGYPLLNATFVNITKAYLPEGNYTVYDGVTGMDQLYFCIKSVDSTLSQQFYSSAKQGPWIVKIG